MQISTESFNDGVPDYFEAGRPDSLSISTWHYKQGGQSLRWDWRRGEELVIHHGIGDVNRTGGWRCRTSFSVWVYMREPVAGLLGFEFREGAKVTGSFCFPLEFSGWRQARPYFHDFPEGNPSSDVDNIRIAAPTETEQGSVFIDFIKFNTLTFGGNSVIPEREARWRTPAPDNQRFPLPDQVTDEQMDGIRKMLGSTEGPGIEQRHVDRLCRQVEELGVVRDEHGIRGPGIDAHYQYLCASGEHGFRDVAYMPDEHGPNWAGMQDPGAMTSLANQVAQAYRAGNDDGQRERLSEAYLLLADHLQDQVLQAGSGFRWNWWVGAAWADSVFLMRALLAETGRLRSHLDFMLYTYNGGVIFADKDPPSNMDFYNLTVPRLLQQCLLQVEPVEQVRWMNAFKAMLERSILQPTGAFKVDGSSYHHAGHYHSYAQGAFMNMPPLILEMNGTPWRLSAEAHGRLRRAMLAQRLYGNRLDLPISMTGRSPYASNYGVIRPDGAQALDVLARCGAPDGTQEVDAEVAAAYLRLVPEAADSEPYRTLGLEPEPDPNGTWVMPYAGLLCHRRDNWLVTVKGQSKYIWGSERQAQRNCFGLFMGLGNLEVLAGGDPVNAEASGRQHHGWDWRRFEGITAPQAPLRAMDEAWRSLWLIFSPETFMGGLSHRGRQGVFGMMVNQPMPGGTTLTGRKSWFFSDGQVLCLGSDICCDASEYPTQTTLCQKALRADEQGQYPATLLNDTKLTDFPEVHVLDEASGHWFMDIQRTGYWVPAGQKLIMARQSQRSRDLFDTEDTEGDFLTAWIDHGTSPDRAGYEYMLVVRATPEELKGFAVEPPYEVVRRDKNAHIVQHRNDGRWSCVLFADQEISPHEAGGGTLPVKSVDRPCMIVAEMVSDGQLLLSVTDPDLNLDMDPVSCLGVVRNRPRILRVTVRGVWRLENVKGTICAWNVDDAVDSVRVVSAEEGETVVEIICRHGTGYELRLTR